MSSVMDAIHLPVQTSDRWRCVRVASAIVHTTGIRLRKPLSLGVQTHQEIDERALAMDSLIASRVRKCPELIEKARSVLERWLETASEDVKPVFFEWREVLALPIEEILAVVEGTDERAVRLRQSSPFCGILSREERTRILLGYESSEEGRQEEERRAP